MLGVGVAQRIISGANARRHRSAGVLAASIGQTQRSNYGGGGGGGSLFGLGATAGVGA
jgi:hypothetical protein